MPRHGHAHRWFIGTSLPHVVTDAPSFCRAALGIRRYETATQLQLEPIVMSAYLEALVAEGVTGYTMEALRRDWQVRSRDACMHACVT